MLSQDRQPSTRLSRAVRLPVRWAFRSKVVLTGAAIALALVIFLNVAPFRGNPADVERWPVIESEPTRGYLKDRGYWPSNESSTTRGYLDYGWPFCFVKRVEFLDGYDFVGRERGTPLVLRKFRPLALAGNGALAALAIAFVARALSRWQSRSFRPQLGLMSLLVLVTVCALGIAGWITNRNAMRRAEELEALADAHVSKISPVPKCVENMLGAAFLEDIRFLRPEEIEIDLPEWIDTEQFAAIRELVKRYPSRVLLDIDPESLKPDDRIPGMIHHDRFGNLVPDDFIPPLEEIDGVQRVRLSCESHDLLSFLDKLRHLRALSVMVHSPSTQYEGEPLPRFGLDVLKGLPELRSLRILWHWQAADDARLYTDVTVLGELKYIEDLCLTSVRFSTDNLTAIAKCQTLRSLSLWDCKFDDEDLSPISRLPNLRMLDLAHSKLTDRGLNNLPPLPALEQLCLDGAPISDSGLMNLRHNKALRFLSVSGTQVTPEGVNALRADMPGLWVRTK